MHGRIVIGLLAVSVTAAIVMSGAATTAEEGPVANLYASGYMASLINDVRDGDKTVTEAWDDWLTYANGTLTELECPRVKNIVCGANADERWQDIDLDWLIDTVLCVCADDELCIKHDVVLCPGVTKDLIEVTTPAGDPIVWDEGCDLDDCDEFDSDDVGHIGCEDDTYCD